MSWWRTVAFWGSFYGMYSYARRDEVSRQNTHPSYFILKQELIFDTWKDGFKEDVFYQALERD
jgi:hypothetical protein